MADSSGRARPPRPEWLDEYDLIGKIGEGTYGLVYLACNRDKSKGSGRTAIKKFKQSKEGDGVSPTAIREIMLLRECIHENIVKLMNVHINHADMSLYLAFDYAEYDLYEIIRSHREKFGASIREYTVKSLLWQILNGINFLHSNWIIHRDLKPSNILIMGEGEENGIVKIADFGLARIFQSPLKPLSDNGVVVTIWYRSPELLLGSKHYTCAVDMWAIGCIFAELLTLKPLFQGVEDKTLPNPFQFDQLDKIFRVLGHPTTEKWPHLQYLPYWQANRQMIQTRKYDIPSLPSIVNLNPKSHAYDLLSRMLEYDPLKRITAAQALDHDYFRFEPLPGKNVFMSGSLNEKVIYYPTRPVEPSNDFDVVGIERQRQVRNMNRNPAASMPPHSMYSNRMVQNPQNYYHHGQMPPSQISNQVQSGHGYVQSGYNNQGHYQGHASSNQAYHQNNFVQGQTVLPYQQTLQQQHQQQQPQPQSQGRRERSTQNFSQQQPNKSRRLG